jgi:SAM-dependent methyltransferase
MMRKLILRAKETLVNRLLQGGRANRRALKANLPQAANPVLLINSFYKAAFGRLAEPEGLAHRIHQLESGVSPEALGAELVGSAEFQARHGSSQKVDTEFLTALYRDGLGRQPDPKGLAHWLAEGEKGATRAKVLTAFAGSDEALQHAEASSLAHMSRIGDPSLIDEPEMDKVAAEFDVYPRIHRDDFIFHFHCNIPTVTREHAINAYFTDGHRSSRQLHELITKFYRVTHSRPSVLEFAAGYGCVSRHLKKLSNQYKIVSCDIHDQALEFLTAEVGVESVRSNKDPDKLEIVEKYDVVFALSFFSHMPHRTWGRWAKKLFDIVNEGGLFIFTTHGPRVLQHWGNPTPEKEGYYFISLSEQKDLLLEDYGSMMVTPYYVFDQMKKSQHAAPIFFQEAFWWGTQDVFIFGRNPSS